MDDTTKPDTVLVLRTCDKDRKSYGGFQWPEFGSVEAPDWSPEPCCGNGLHGLLWGTGDASLTSNADDAIWMVVEVDASSVVDLDDKVKFPRGNVVYAGSRTDAVAYLVANGGATKSPHWATVTAGNWGTATAGNWGTATVGNWGTATAGDRGTATAGYEGTATVGNWGTATAGDEGTATAGTGGTATAGNWGTATAGNWGTATAGDRGTATAGDRGTATAGYEGTATVGTGGTATAGNWGTATAGDRGTATAGDRGTATVGTGGTATAGTGGVISVEWHDASAQKFRRAVGEIDGEILKPGVRYCIKNGKWMAQD